MRIPRGELLSFATLNGGVDEAANLIGVDEDFLQSAIDGRKLPREIEKVIDRGVEDWKDENTLEGLAVERVGEVLEMYPELIAVFDNDGVADALLKHEEFTDIFYKDPTVYKDEASGKMVSNGGIYPGALRVIVDWATQTKRGTPRARQASLKPMVDALVADNFDISNRDSNFWRWFRSIYE